MRARGERPLARGVLVQASAEHRDPRAAEDIARVASR
jgi:hypothetical protein